MTQRVTQKQLENMVEAINTVKGYAIKPYTNGRANIGTYYIDGAYGGVKLVQIESDTGGVRTISQNGYGTKRELLAFLHGMLA